MTIDRIDMEEITTRYAELRDERADLATDADESDEPTAANEALSEWDNDNADELKELAELIEELRGAGGGDHQWEGDWFPSELIAEDDFEEYAEELADSIGAVDSNASWPLSCIDWEQAARELAQDYSSVEYQGKSYYWR